MKDSGSLVHVSFTPGDVMSLQSSRYPNRCHRQCRSLSWVYYLLVALVLFLLRRSDSSPVKHSANPLADEVPTIVFANGYDLTARHASSSDRSISEHWSFDDEPSTSKLPSSVLLEGPSPSPVSTYEAREEEIFPSFLGSDASARSRSSLSSEPEGEASAEGLSSQRPTRRQHGLLPEDYPTPPMLSSASSSASSSDFEGGASAERFQSSWTEWMTYKDKRAKEELGELCRGIQRSDRVAQSDYRFFTLMEEGLPEGARLPIRVLSHDMVTGSLTASLSSASSLSGEGSGGEEQEEGSLNENLALVYSRGRILGTGARSIVVQADFLESGAPSSPRGRRKRRDQRDKSPQASKKEETSSTQTGGKAGFFARLRMRKQKGRAPGKPAYPPLALRFLVRNVRGVHRSGDADDPFASEDDVEAYIMKESFEEERLLNLAGRRGGSELLRKTYGMLFPCATGQLEGYPSILRTVSSATSWRDLLNFFTVSSLVGGALGMLQESMMVTPSVRVYVTKKLIKLVAHLHHLGLVHRNLTSLNVLVDYTGELYLSGFRHVLEIGQTFACREVVSAHTVEPWLALCELHFPDRQMTAHYTSDAWSLGMMIFTWLCRDYPFDNMNYVSMGETDRLASAKVIAALYDSFVVSSENEDKPFRAPVKWERCKTFRPELHPEVKDAVEGLLDVNPKTRYRPYNMITEHPLFRADDPTTPESST
ncbi:rhoptry kinase family protein rop11 (incomplete catalytic triad) [Cystoisospora suis]|uniref:non-specific serine/threonine protein kinase n=1 Tax=Cystoisospora suis TaxID=483139 RepID=A0A2C6KVP9_9APIC|nr:rhoptry kinase family protein rop11 (incomplete catalytic triad) [Cystoisospora suis]